MLLLDSVSYMLAKKIFGSVGEKLEPVTGSIKFGHAKLMTETKELRMQEQLSQDKNW